jgi:hypothetical protein
MIMSVRMICIQRLLFTQIFKVKGTKIERFRMYIPKFRNIVVYVFLL